MATTVGVARVAIYLEETFSLKDKRQVIRSITQLVRNKFNVSIAETSDLNDPRVATLVFACVSNNAAHVDQMLQTVLEFIENRLENGTIGEIETEKIPLGD